MNDPDISKSLNAPKAHFELTNKTISTQAVSLQYNGETPIITANGEDELATAMIAIANAHNIPIYENPALLNLLSQLEIGDAIPEELYLVVAHILAFVYQLQGKTPEPTK
jgi:flagellar biosynthesis protein